MTLSHEPGDIPASLDTHVSDQLRKWILDNTWEDGTRVLEVTVAEQLGVSRGPVRDALKRLAEEGLVELIPRRGAYVRWVPSQDLREIVLIRQSLESVALRLAMEKDLTKLCGELEAAVDSMRGASDSSDWERILRAEIEFHDLIYGCANSRRLSQMWGHMRPTVISTFRNDRAYYENAAQVTASHQRLVEKISSGDPRTASSELCHHILPSTRRLSAPIDPDGTR